jgi:hypothetical protein
VRVLHNCFTPHPDLSRKGRGKFLPGFQNQPLDQNMLIKERKTDLARSLHRCSFLAKLISNITIRRDGGSGTIAR